MVEIRAVIALYKHGSQGFAFAYPNPAGGVLDLTGYSVSVAESSPGLDGQVTVAITNAAAGEVSGTITWAEAVPDGLQSWFRLQFTKSGADSLGFPALWVQVK
jgi:hypothetical protein